MSTLALLGGTVIDGTGADPVKADVLVRDGSISRVGAGPFTADERLDVTGLVVAPGFIDIHTHSDLSLMVDPRGASKLLQGVTTEVIGNCGMSPAPLVAHDPRLRESMAYLDQPIPWDWSSYDEFLRRLDGCALNVASLVGHISLRAAVMGFDRRPPTDGELRAMQQLLAECLEAGAVGMSTGLIYPPSCYAETAELIALGEVLARFGRLYTSHIRGEAAQLLSSIAEALEIGRRSGCRVQISHLKAAGRANWGHVAEAIELIEAALDEGLDVAADVYPYTAGATQLTALLPPWVHEGGLELLLQRLADPAVRERIQREAADPPPDWPGYSLATREDAESRVITSTDRAENRWLVGLNLAEASERLGLAPALAVCDIVTRDRGATGYVAFHLSEDDVRLALAQPFSCIGSDGIAISADGPWAEQLCHPRFYGTFARVLGRYSRDEGLFSLAEAVRKMTSLPADRLGLGDRGRIAAGRRADLVVFEPETVGDRATFEQPHQYAAGIRYVVVNGQVAARSETVTAARAGRVLRA